YDYDRSIKNRFVAGILIFVHYRHLKVADILKTTVSQVDAAHFGFIGRDTTLLPTVLADFEAQNLVAHYEQYPTSTFALNGRIIGIKRYDEYTLLIGAYECPARPLLLLVSTFILFIIVSIMFLRLSYRIMVLQI
ncbi:MAG TPA: hypothetical protein PKC25_10960, partial [Candidatus Rifleibacterium sp.]|nr:hypothetical protein [Candidatus Rifleibacterium sp.]